MQIYKSIFLKRYDLYAMLNITIQIDKQLIIIKYCNFMLNKFKNTQHKNFAIEFPERQVSLHSMLVGCGFNEEHDKSYRWHGLKRGPEGFAIWQYTVSGMGMLDYEGKQYEVKPGQAMLIHIPHDHCYYLPDHAEKWEFIYLNLQGSELRRICKEAEERFGPVLTFSPDSEAVELAFDILKNGKDYITNPRKASSLGYQFGMLLLEEAISGSKDKREPVFIRNVISYAMQNLNKPIGIDELAKVAGYSRYHFSRVFNQWYGKSPSLFLREIRLKRAVRLLQTEMITVGDISYRCGFNDPSYFCKVFRQEFGVSPETFRKLK